MIGKHRWHWPEISHNGPPVPGEVKRVSGSDLSRLCRAAVAAGWSATGRPSWLDAHASELEFAYLTARVVESPEALRCLATVRPAVGDAVAFTVDVSMKTFARLPTITPNETVELLHRLLASAPFLSVDSMPGWRDDAGLEGSPGDG